MDEVKAEVVFVVDYLDEVVAIFPALPFNRDGSLCVGYSHSEQHFGVSLKVMWPHTARRASPEEYAELRAELEAQGYDLTPIPFVEPRHTIERYIAAGN